MRFRFDSDKEMLIEESLAPFFCNKKIVSDVNVCVSHGFSDAPIPRTEMIGEDLLMSFFREGDSLLCMTKGGQDRWLACCVCDAELRELKCYLDLPAGSAADSIGNLLRMIPLMRILLQRGALLFHASQIEAGGVGLLFSAPSGTGKTTQARLWERYRGARIICNDRTLTDGHHTYGFPVDGSSPVISAESFPIGAVTVLEQAPENTIRRLHPREALLRLLPQLIIDTWDHDSRARATELLLELLSRVPVYLLRCTPDEGAVECLEQQLWKDGVIIHE